MIRVWIQRTTFLCRAFLLVCLTTAATFCNVFAFDLKCRVETSTHDGKKFNEYRCDGLVVTADNTTVTSVNGNSSPDANRQILSIQRQTLHYLPKGIAKLFPGLLSLDISDSDLKSLKQADLKPFTKLQELALVSNDLETLDDNLFAFNTELVFVNFSFNKIKIVGEGILTPLTKLQSALFKGNDCIDASGTKGDFTALKNTFKSQCVKKIKA